MRSQITEQFDGFAANVSEGRSGALARFVLERQQQAALHYTDALRLLFHVCGLPRWAKEFADPDLGQALTERRILMMRYFHGDFASGDVSFCIPDAVIWQSGRAHAFVVNQASLPKEILPPLNNNPWERSCDMLKAMQEIGEEFDASYVLDSNWTRAKRPVSSRFT
jgi:hypothetical protein